MRIQHNIAALNATRQLNRNSDATSKNLEKLSSGYKINSAADDAAGLAISEKMRSQISGLDQASSNASDGISLVQTAEGALNETTSILQRMKELATQSSNGTYQNDVDRENIQKEVTSLKSEVDRISTSTNFNKINLLDGSLGGGSSTAGVAAKLELSNTAKGTTDLYTFHDAVAGIYTAKALTGATTLAGDKAGFSITYKDDAGNNQVASVNLTVKNATTLTADDGTEYTIAAGTSAADTGKAIIAELKKNSSFSSEFTVADAGSGVLAFTASAKGTKAGTVTAFAETATPIATGVVAAAAQPVTYTKAASDAYEAVDVTKFTAYTGATGTTADVFTLNNAKFAFVDTTISDTDLKKLDPDVNYVRTAAAGSPTAADATAMSALIKQKTGVNAAVDGSKDTQINFLPTAGTSTAGTGALTLQIGASASADQQVSLSIADMSSKGLKISNVSVATQPLAAAAIKTIEAAINTVSGTRADLGALQNRLEHTVSNLGVTSENLTSAESRIRDVDMAKEMMEMTKNNILTSAAQSMLSQANQQPQSVLKLLQ